MCRFPCPTNTIFQPDFRYNVAPIPEHKQQKKKNNKKKTHTIFIGILCFFGVCPGMFLEVLGTWQRPRNAKRGQNSARHDFFFFFLWHIMSEKQYFFFFFFLWRGNAKTCHCVLVSCFLSMVTTLLLCFNQFSCLGGWKNSQIGTSNLCPSGTGNNFSRFAKRPSGESRNAAKNTQKKKNVFFFFFFFFFFNASVVSVGEKFFTFLRFLKYYKKKNASLIILFSRFSKFSHLKKKSKKKN